MLRRKSPGSTPKRIGVLNILGAPEPKQPPPKKKRQTRADKIAQERAIRAMKFPDDDEEFPVLRREKDESDESIDSDSSQSESGSSEDSGARKSAAWDVVFKSKTRKQPLKVVRGDTQPRNAPPKQAPSRPVPSAQIVIPDSPPRTTSSSRGIVIPDSPPRTRPLSKPIVIPDSPPRTTSSSRGIVIPDSPPRTTFFGRRIVIPESPPRTVPDSQPEIDYTDYQFSDEENGPGFANISQDEDEPKETGQPANDMEILIQDDAEFVLDETEPAVAADVDIFEDELEPVISQPPPEPKITPTFRALRGQMSYRDLPALVRFVSENPDLTAELLGVLDSPETPDSPVARYWLARVREVIPDTPETLATLGAYAYEPDPLWPVIGKALRMNSTDALGVLAEYSWATGQDPAALTGHLRPAELSNVDKLIAGLVKGQALPAKAPTLGLASMDEDKKRPDWWPIEKAAQNWLKERIEERQKELVNDDHTYADWMKELGDEDSLGYARSLDRLGDMINTYWADRVCVAVLHKRREIGICANRPDKFMKKDLETLLTASRAVGPAAEEWEKRLLAQFKQRAERSSQKPIKSSRERAPIRLRKTLAFLRALEEKYGRIRVVAYDDDLPKRYGTPQEIHAEMQALSIARSRPSGAMLGVSKLCCMKCWLILTDIWPTVFDREFATHMTTYPWPTSDLLQDVTALTTLFSGPPPAPQQVQDALHTPSGRAALVRAIFNVKAKSPAPDTGYASSQEAPPSLPPELEEPDLPPEDPREFQDYLDSDAALTPEEESARWGDQPRPLAPRNTGPKIVNGLFTKAKGTKTNLPDRSGTISLAPIETAIPQIPVPKTPKTPKTPAKQTPGGTTAQTRETAELKRKPGKRGSGSPPGKRQKR